MPISASESVAIILVCALCTFLERYLPFAFFEQREVPSVVRYLGKILPMAVITTLVVYCMRTTDFSAAAASVPQLAAAAFTALLHLWRRNALLSIFGGTVCYMLLVQLGF